MGVEVVPYSGEWPAQFARVAADLRAALVDVPGAVVEHVGSTSVPGLAAKPVLDIDVVVGASQVTSAVAALESVGYAHRGDLGVAGREAFRAPDEAPRRHVYVCVRGALSLRNHLAVRDMLRRDAGLREEYAAVKLALAAEPGTDMETYLEGKSPVLQKVLARAGLTEDERSAILHVNARPPDPRPGDPGRTVGVHPPHLAHTAPLRLRQRTFDAARPAVMAIINRTPDSFWSGNRHTELDSALAALDQAVDDGADIVDVGGVRAGQEGGDVDAKEEIGRVLPFLEAARSAHPDLVLSLDTWRSEVAREAAAVGVDLVNDTWAGHDPDLVHVAAEVGAGIVCSHTGGLPPRTDPVAVRYADAQGTDDLAVVRDVLRTLETAAARAVAAGVPADRVLIDPTLDFGKTTRHSLTVLRHTEDLTALGFPILQALSRKDFVGESLDLPPDDRLDGTLAATAVAAWLGTTVFRAHDVRATRRVVDMVATIRGDRAPRLSVRGEP